MFAIAAALAVVPGALEAKDVAPVAAVSAETQATAGSGADGAVVVADPTDPARSLILAGAESAGVDVFDLSGPRNPTPKARDIPPVDLRAAAPPGGRALLAALDPQAEARNPIPLGSDHQTAVEGKR